MNDIKWCGNFYHTTSKSFYHTTSSFSYHRFFVLVRVVFANEIPYDRRVAVLLTFLALVKIHAIE